VSSFPPFLLHRCSGIFVLIERQIPLRRDIRTFEAFVVSLPLFSLSRAGKCPNLNASAPGIQNFLPESEQLPSSPSLGNRCRLGKLSSS